MRPHPLSEPRRAQAGTSIVEVMVAVAIALFITAALVSVCVNLKFAFNAQDQLAQLQDNERLGLSILTNSLQTAGYFPDPVANRADDPSNLAAATNATYGNLAAGQAVAGTSGTAPASDTLTTRYVSAVGDGLMNCQGQVNAGAGKLLMTNIFAITANNELACSVDGGATFVPLVSNVASMAVAYGTDSSGGGRADRYLSAAAVSASALWPQVKTARITLSFGNPFVGTPGQPSTIDWVQTVNLMNKS